MQTTSSPVVLLAIYAFLVSLPVTVLPGENVHTDNIVVILDASGSMGEEFSSDPTKTRMNAAKEALQTVLTTILDGTNIGLLVFSGSNVKNHWVYKHPRLGDGKVHFFAKSALWDSKSQKEQKAIIW